MREATNTGTVGTDILHAVEYERSYGVGWIRPMCQSAFRSDLDTGVILYDYRYRGGIANHRPCRHPACRKGFEVLVG